MYVCAYFEDMAGDSLIDRVKSLYVLFAFFSALCFGASKSLLIGPIAGLVLIVGNLGVILGLFPAHVVWTVYTIYKTSRFDAAMKIGMLLGLPAVFGLWLVVSIAGSVLVGVGYGFFTPWVSSFEAFRQEDESKKFYHSIVDGTWETIKGSCTVVRDFADLCYHSFPIYLKELCLHSSAEEPHRLRLIYVPACILVGLIGLIVEIPLFTVIAIVKSPYMLFRGWHRLIEDLISREGPFLETACIPIAGLAILLWPLVVIGSIMMAMFASFFIGLYGSVIVHQERSFRQGIAYVIAMAAEFDEYTNDLLYLREGTVLPKPRYRQRKAFNSSDPPIRRNQSLHDRYGADFPEAREALVPSLMAARSVREVIKEVKMVQIWESVMKQCEAKGKVLLEMGVITPTDLSDWLKAKHSSNAAIVDVGLPCFSFLHNVLNSIRAGSEGLVLLDGTEVTHMNRPRDRVLDWFFSPILVLKEQIRALRLEEGEIRYLEKALLFGNDKERAKSWDNDSFVPEGALRAAQIEGITRRMMGMSRSVSKFPTYRRRYQQVVKDLVVHSMGRDGYALTRPSVSTSLPKVGSTRSIAPMEMV